MIMYKDVKLLDEEVTRNIFTEPASKVGKQVQQLKAGVDLVLI